SHRGRLRDVGHHRMAAEPLGGGAGGFQALVIDDDGCAFLGKALGDCRPKPARGARDQCHLVLQPVHGQRLSLPRRERQTPPSTALPMRRAPAGETARRSAAGTASGSLMVSAGMPMARAKAAKSMTGSAKSIPM